MNSFLRLSLVAAIAFFATAAGADSDSIATECLKSVSFLAPIDSPENRKYAPDREVHLLHLALDVTPDFKQRTVAGKAVLQFKPIAKPVREVKLDAVDLNVQSVEATTKIQSYQATTEKLVITFA